MLTSWKIACISYSVPSIIDRMFVCKYMHVRIYAHGFTLLVGHVTCH